MMMMMMMMMIIIIIITDKKTPKIHALGQVRNKNRPFQIVLGTFLAQFGFGSTILIREHFFGQRASFDNFFGKQADF